MRADDKFAILIGGLELRRPGRIRVLRCDKIHRERERERERECVASETIARTIFPSGETRPCSLSLAHIGRIIQSSTGISAGYDRLREATLREENVADLPPR